MSDDTLTVASRTHDGLDDIRSAALARGRWLLPETTGRRFLSLGHRGTWGLREVVEVLRARTPSVEAGIGRRLAECGDEDGRAAALCLLMAGAADDHVLWVFRSELGALVARVGGWTPGEVAVMAAELSTYRSGLGFGEGARTVLTAGEHLDAEGRRAAAPQLRALHAVVMGPGVSDYHRRPVVKRLRALLESADASLLPDGLIPASVPWAAPLRERVATGETTGLAAFVRHLAGLSGPRPSQRWQRTCQELAAAAATGDMVTAMLRVLAEGDPQCAGRNEPATGCPDPHNHYHFLVHEQDGDLARGVVWAAALAGGADTARLLSALALRTGTSRTGVADDLKLAGAAVNALAGMDDPGALEALWRLQRRITHRALVKQLDTALVTAAGRQGITPGQLIERSVPSHGLGEGRTLERDLGGGYRALLAVEDDATVRLSYLHPDGRPSRTAPAAVKDGFPDELKQVKALVREVRSTLSGERARLEGLMSAGREWPYDEWSRHYRDHPLTGVLTRRLIWEFQDTDGVWQAQAPGTEPPSAAGRVRLWHPISASVDDIREWRARLVAAELRQPFKQAFREIYLLTPAEEETAGYSNRFAAHIVHYGKLYALFKERRWQANYLAPYDGGHEGEARGEFGDGQWRACFYHEPALDPDDAYAYATEYAATDQVRFERRAGRRWVRAELAEVPPLVFSEAMRDVDLFVGVTSIAADPDWADRGEDRYAAYWRRATFGELTEGAEVRRAALERILPRLRTAGRCRIEGRFLVVRGDLATYRIHLGSANVLMEPDDAYLCIVPARRQGTGKVFLPFEDDRLSLVVSKAMMLAADTRITDESVLRQIRRGA